MNMSSKEVVYFIGNSIGRVKIGYSANFPQRYKNLCNASGDDLKVIYKHTPQHLSMKGLETRLHQHYSPYRVLGEWFTLPEDTDFKEVCHYYDSV